ncbi:hypothetical protein BRADI_1g24051v3 [Brachypodium distachyon]|uniref:Uncharacterized protein n=1 Tax=Brachypodium distachyon TaxID=15368 RepID=A0A2K2DKU1_BRADI|nr:hypothetical protein BRADI_1g24051v3 [Brachypodium distachyon]
MSSSLVHLELGLPERLGYVQCKFCTTTLLVSVPCSNLLKMVAVQCGRCAGVLSVSVASPPSSPTPAPPSVELPLQELGVDPPPREWSDESTGDEEGDGEGEAAESNAAATVNKLRKQRTPSAYNCFIKEEIKRIKALEPNITHKEAFSTAAKNWAHLPRIQHRGN